MSILDTAQIGSLVKINLELSQDRLNKETIDAIKLSPKCKISDFRITDGKGIGVVLKLSNGKEKWFFENEIDILDKFGNVIEKDKYIKEEKNLINSSLMNLNYANKQNINELLNPLNFILWLVVSLKDNL